MRTFAVIALLGFSSVSLAGVVMQMEHRDLDGPTEKPDSHVFYFQNGAFRQEEIGDGNFNVFRNQAMYTIDTKNRSYRKVDKAQMDKLGEQLGGLRSKLEAQMKNMPAEQRAAMEQAMGKIGVGTKKEPVITVRDTGRNETAAGIGCRVWELLTDGSKQSEVCLAAPGSIPEGAEIVKSMREIGSFVGGLAATFGGKTATGLWKQLQMLNGVPVITREFGSNGKAESEQRAVSVKSSVLPASLFEVPAGFTEKKIPGLSAGGVIGDDDDDK
ncbi:MAG: hypothetical protein ABIT36_11265 [Steroidobacteraceae bacterium]